MSSRPTPETAAQTARHSSQEARGKIVLAYYHYVRIVVIFFTCVAVDCNHLAVRIRFVLVFGWHVGCPGARPSNDDVDHHGLYRFCKCFANTCELNFVGG